MVIRQPRRARWGAIWVAMLIAVALPAALAPAAQAAPPDATPRLLSWGYNEQGQLGNGMTVTTSPYGNLLPGWALNGANTSGRWATTPGSLDGGYDQSCGLGADDSRAYCWGGNEFGQLGIGKANVSRDDSVPVRVSNGANVSGAWASISAGDNYFTCGIGTDDSALCWGRTEFGQLGIGPTTDDSVLMPSRVSNGANAGGTWRTVSAGQTHACGLGGDGSAYCWGHNDYGQLGDGTKVNETSPVRVSNGANASGTWKALSAGEKHSCGLGTDDSAYCWGGNTKGQLGNAATADDSVPVRVSAGANASGGWKSVAAGLLFSCGIGLDDSAYCWGDDTYGQLGNGSTDDSALLPVRVSIPGNQVVTSLATDASAKFACAMTSDDSAYCWGSNSLGQLGNASVLDASVPVSPSLMPYGTPMNIAIGTYHTLLVDAFSADASLSSLGATGLTPAFTPATLDYSIAVAYSTTTLAISADPFEAGATAAVESAATVTGSTPNFTVSDLPVGTTDVAITVTAPDDMTQLVYHVSVTRPPRPPRPDPPAPSPSPSPVPVPSPVPPGSSLLLVDGTPRPVQVDPNARQDGLDVTADGWTMNLDGLGPDGRPLDLGPDNTLVLDAERDVRVSGTGFSPGSEVGLFAVPDGTLPAAARELAITHALAQHVSRAAFTTVDLGRVTVGSDGNFAAVRELPRSLKAGNHVLQVVGYAPSGAQRALNLGIVVRSWIDLARGTRAKDGRHDRIEVGGRTGGFSSGATLRPYIRFRGQPEFRAGTATIIVQADGSFTWSRKVRSDKGVAAYMEHHSVTSNHRYWKRIR